METMGGGQKAVADAEVRVEAAFERQSGRGEAAS